MVRVSKSISFPKWMLEDIDKQDTNVSERVRELVMKGKRLENILALSDQDIGEMIKQARENRENKKGSGPTGHCIYAVGSPLRFSSDFERLNPRTSVSTTSAKITE